MKNHFSSPLKQISISLILALGSDLRRVVLRAE